MATDLSGGDSNTSEEVADFSTDTETSQRAQTHHEKWINERLTSSRQLRKSRFTAAIIYGVVGTLLTALSAYLAWSLFEVVLCTIKMLVQEEIEIESLPANGYTALLATFPIGATMLAGVSIIAISIKTITAQRGNDGNEVTDAISAGIKITNQQ